MEKDQSAADNKIYETLDRIPVVLKLIAFFVLDTLINLFLVAFAREINNNTTKDMDVIIFLIIKPVILLLLAIYTGIKIDHIRRGAKMIADGNYNYKINTVCMLPSMESHARDINRISEGISKAVEARLKSEKMKVELITNVSHDIKTPLTSIINYAGLICKEECENKDHREYSEILIKQAERLKKLLEDLIEASKASTGNLEVKLEPCEASVFITQAAGEFEEKLRDANISLVVKKTDEPLTIMADGRRMWRIFDNLLNNICKYSMPKTRAYINLEKTESLKNGKKQDVARFVFKNTSKEELDISEEELVERFVRGDLSRNTEGNGLGLSIAKSMAELQGGSLKIEIDGDLFKAVLDIPLA